MFAKLENLLFHIDLKIPISEVESNQATDWAENSTDGIILIE